MSKLWWRIRYFCFGVRCIPNLWRLWWFWSGQWVKDEQWTEWRDCEPWEAVNEDLRAMV